MAVGFSLFALLGADLYAHHRAQRTAGLNIWGYRGPVAAAKQSGEIRLAFLGGSTLFGYGVSWDEAIPAVVERTLRSTLGPTPIVTAVNLGYNNEGAYSFAFTLKDFAYLAYDAAVLYEGYNDMMADPEAPNTAIYRHESAVFQLTGYYPILPLFLHEKAMALRTGGDLATAYEDARVGRKTVFNVSFADRTSAAALESISSVTNSLGRQLARLTDAPTGRIVPTQAGCAYPWAEYCESVFVAVTAARAAGKHVVVVSQPRVLEPIASKHASQQAALRDMLSRKFATDAGVTYVDMSDAVDLSNPALCYDGMHLTVSGNAQVASALAHALVPVVRATKASTR
jgi:hypothetical protein